MKNKLIINLIIIALLAGCGLYFTANLLVGFGNVGPGTDFSFNGSYGIDPTAILALIHGGDINVFEPKVGGSVTYLTEHPNPWRQADFEEVVNTLYQFVWKEPLNDNWSLYRMFFRANCKDNVNGFIYAEFIYFKESSNENLAKYTVRGISVDLQNAEVSWGENIYPRPLWGWKGIKLNKIKVSAEDAVRQAEERGGQETRSSVNGLCQIYADYYPENYDFDGWRIAYGGNPNLSDIFILIPAK